jgi:propanediol dehydratase large subunit
VDKTSRSRVRVLRPPVRRNFRPRAHPNVVEGRDVLHKARERPDTTGTTNNARVEGNSLELAAFRAEEVEFGFQEIVEVVAVGETGAFDVEAAAGEAEGVREDERV